MVCRSINSICPIHGFLLSRSVQATGGGSCWAVLPGLISKGYKLHYPAQSEPAPSGTAPSIHPLCLCASPFPFSPNAASWWPPSLFPSSIPLSIFLVSWWLMGVVFGALSISFHGNTHGSKKQQTQTVFARADTHQNTYETVGPGPGRSNRGSHAGLIGKQATVYGWDSINLSLKPETEGGILEKADHWRLLCKVATMCWTLQMYSCGRTAALFWSRNVRVDPSSDSVSSKVNAARLHERTLTKQHMNSVLPLSALHTHEHKRPYTWH